MVMVDHSYSKAHSGASVDTPKSSTATGRTTLAVQSNCTNVGPLEEETPTVPTTMGHSVSLMSSQYKIIVAGITMSGDNLHGHKIPSGFTKLAISKIDPDVELWAGLKGDDELTSGCITAWPLKFMKRLM